MTINISLVSHTHAICVTDRRLSSPSGAIFSERGNKLTVFQCRNAKGFITYNGIGFDGHSSPNDWLLENPALPHLEFNDFIRAITAIADRKISSLSAKYRELDVRHSFVVGGFLYDNPIISLISNYETLHGPDKQNAEQHFTAETKFNRAGSGTHPAFTITGAVPQKGISKLNATVNRIREMKEPEKQKSAMIKILRDAAFKEKRRGTIGTSAMSVTIPLYGDMITDLHVVGGTTFHEMPNMIAPGMLIRDAYIDTSLNQKSRYNPITKRANVAERKCRKCKNPVPEGYKQCGICDEKV